ncbi:hypothetical protein MHU86_17816 [Fragilaria crotonensis]|nr:hypothetical protein MHU86_17816 [Fragilaria crotonensis]
MEDTIIKLQQASDQADTAVKDCYAKFKESENAVMMAKTLLKDLDEDDQQRIKVTDTMLPELLGILLTDKEAYETAVKRFETNKRYLALYKMKTAAVQQHH